MEVAVQSVISVTTMVHTTLVTTVAQYTSFPTLGKNPWSTLSNRLEQGLQGGKTRPKTVWITIGDTSPHSNTKLDASSSAIQSASPSVVKDALSLSSPVATVQAVSSNVVATTSLPVAPPDPSNRCPLKPDPMDQQSSSYELCQKTVSFGGICCTPFQLGISATPSTAVSSTPTSTLVSLTSTPAPFSPPSTSPSQLSPTPHPDTAPPIEPATKPSASRSPLPTELTTTRTPVKILPILIPCALAGAGIVAFGIWCVLWRDKRKSSYNPPTSAINTPKIINGQEVYQGGNFAVAAAFRPGMGEMARKDREGLNDEEKPAWKAGYRKYRDSRLPGSGLLKVMEVKGLAM